MEEGTQFYVQRGKISLLQKQLSRQSEACEGIGMIWKFSDGEHIHLTNFASSFNKDVTATYDLLTRVIPAGLTFAGFFVAGASADAIGKICKKHLQKCVKRITSRPQFLVLGIGEAEPVLYQCDSENWQFTGVPLNVIDYNVLDRCLLLRLRGSLTIGQEYTDKDRFKEDLRREIHILQNTMREDMTVFHIQDTQLLLRQAEEDHLKMKCKEILGHIVKDDEDEFDRKKKQRNIDYSKVTVHVDLLSQDTGHVATDKGLLFSPIIHHTHGTFQQLDITLPLDVVAYIHPERPCGEVHSLLTGAITSQLDAMYYCLVNHQNGRLHTPVPYHFRPVNVGHLVTVLYPNSLGDEALQSQRKELHDVLFLPDNVPQLRRQNHHIFPDEQLPGGYLINPHIGLSPSAAKSGVSTVRGLYTYHHYMQDRVDDNGWGCAYRSLQTLVSWFRFQGYTKTDIPTHRQIQQALVDVGDKDHKFVGSKKWIGSTEVSYVLDQLYGITSKIMFVSTGSELESKGRELAMHFETQGTPIMIGGGVLAHTIIGVDFDEVTGSLKFLILDPHYTGGEDIKVIQDKGWCGWKGPDFWDQHAYYNLCLPQAPVMI